MKRRSRVRGMCLFLAVVGLVWLAGYPIGPQAAASPDEPGPCSITSRHVTIDGRLETDIYYPTGNQCSAAIATPYPGIVFAHGFSMFGLTNGAANNAGHGKHLASWGYVTAIPRLPDDAGQRIIDMQATMAYLETENNTAGSFLYQKVDVNRLGAAGHSFGGATVLALAARDSRVKAVVALDPVYHGGPSGGDEIWDHDAEGPLITAPTSIQGAPSSNCNSEADYAEIYPFVGSVHKAQFFIVGASHCDFMDPGDPMNLCSLFCDGDTDPARTRLSQKYMTAWFNYYLYYDTDFYAYLYGPAADGDIGSGVIERQVDTAPRDVTAAGQYKAVLLAWSLYGHPIVAGYNIYRRLAAETYPAVPQIHAGPTDQHLDEGLAGGETYFYKLCSRDAAGNEHQLSSQVQATTLGEGPPEVTPTPEPEGKVYLPCIAKYWPR